MFFWFIAIIYGFILFEGCLCCIVFVFILEFYFILIFSIDELIKLILVLVFEKVGEF